ncbi:MAG: hypothetical protein JNK81_05435 [Anaerolineales bacterium]|nr:hypothetical protein [Anaerolineales bacterium]
MSRHRRLIKLAFDQLSRETFDVDKVCDTPKNSFEFRRRYSRKEFSLLCCECDQELKFSNSKHDRGYFKHQQGHAYCTLTDKKISPSLEEHEKFIEILRWKESDRHKELKNKIGNLLYKVEGIDKSSITIDNKFIVRGNEKRRPDVYCKYYDKEFVFEIQLSDLSLGYIQSRYEFYKKHGIYLIWILDNFDIHNQGTLEKDIKYLTKYENFFKLDESIGETLYLECEYKDVYLTEKNEIRTKWQKKSISLSQIRFDNEDYQIYYSKFNDNKIQAEIQQSKRSEEIKETEERRIVEQRLYYSEMKADNIIKEIKWLRERKEQDFSYISIQISELDEEELQILNSRLQFIKKSPVIYWLTTATQTDTAFIEFVLTCDEIDINVNASSKDGKTAFQALYENKRIRRHDIIAKLLFKRGYILIETDKIFFSKLSSIEREGFDNIVFDLCNRLTDRTLVDAVFVYEKQLCSIESAKQKEIIGFNYKQNEWLAFANNAIQNYPKHWEYIELAFKKFGLWDTLAISDKKRTFANKVKSFYLSRPKQDFDFDRVFRNLYPELGGLENTL